MKTYTFADLKNRYNLPQAGLYKFINRHIIEINKNGTHAYKMQNKWFFDDFAISVLDRLRNYGQASFSDVQTIQNLNDTISKLQQELITAQKMIINQQIEITNLKDQLLFDVKEKGEIKDQLASASFELLQIKSKSDDLDTLSKSNSWLQNELNQEAIKNAQLKEQFDKLLEQTECLIKQQTINKSEPIRQYQSAGWTGWNRRGRANRIKLRTPQKEY